MDTKSAVIDSLNMTAKWGGKLYAKIENMKIGGLTKVFLYAYVFNFIATGSLYTVGLFKEFIMLGKVNYQAINQFVPLYFGTSVVMTFGIIGKALIDKDDNGKPDVWETPEPDNNSRRGPNISVPNTPVNGNNASVNVQNTVPPNSGPRQMQ